MPEIEKLLQMVEWHNEWEEFWLRCTLRICVIPVHDTPEHHAAFQQNTLYHGKCFCYYLNANHTIDSFKQVGEVDYGIVQPMLLFDWLGVGIIFSHFEQKSDLFFMH